MNIPSPARPLRSKRRWNLVVRLATVGMILWAGYLLQKPSPRQRLGEEVGLLQANLEDLSRQNAASKAAREKETPREEAMRLLRQLMTVKGSPVLERDGRFQLHCQDMVIDLECRDLPDGAGVALEAVLSSPPIRHTVCIFSRHEAPLVDLVAPAPSAPAPEPVRRP